MNSLAKKTENKLFELYDINDLIIRGGIKIIASWIREHEKQIEENDDFSTIEKADIQDLKQTSEMIGLELEDIIQIIIDLKNE